MGLMTEKGITEFKSKIFDPMNDAWAIMKWMRDTEPKDDKFWEEYAKKSMELPNKFGNTEISQSLSRVLLDAGSEVSKIGRQN